MSGGHRYILGGDGGHDQKRWTAPGAAAAVIGNGPPVVSACNGAGAWVVIFNRHLEGHQFPAVHALAAELDRRRNGLRIP